MGPHVEDLAQETFLRAFRALPAFDPDGAARVSTWLLTIATRLAIDAHKKKRLPTEAVDAGVKLLDPSTPETERARRELRRRITVAASKLDVRQWAAFLLADLHGFTTAEIAEALSIPENTVRTRLFRARQHMRAALRDLNPEDK